MYVEVCFIQVLFICEKWENLKDFFTKYIIKLQARRKWGGWSGFSPPQFLAKQLTLSQPGGADYAHHSTTSPPPGFSDLATGLLNIFKARVPKALS